MSDTPTAITELREARLGAARQQNMASRDANTITLIIEGLEIPVLSARISRSIDTVADAWTAEIPWTPGVDKELDRRVGPYTYCRAQIYIGSRLVNTGRLYTVKNIFGKNGLTKQLEFWSYTADLVDSMMPPNSGWQWNNSSLHEIASALCRPFGITVSISKQVTGKDYTQINEKFDIIQGEITQTYADLFTKLAFQRGGLVTNDRYGMLLLTMGAKIGPVVASLGEMELEAYRRHLDSTSARSQSWEAAYDGRKRFATYAVYGQSGNPEEYGDQGILSEALDAKVPPGRRTNIIVSDQTGGNVGVTAAWHRSRQLVDALTIQFPVIGYYTPAGELWDPNDFVNIKAPSMDINIATKFLVRQIDYEYTSAGETGLLHLVPPEVYTGESLREPWSGRWQ